MTKLFVGGLPYSINNQSLNDLFATFGQVGSAVVITDKFTNQSKGFGFVEMLDESAANEAIQKLDGSELEGRRLGVSIAKPREDNNRSTSGYNNRGGQGQSYGSNDRDNNRNFYKRDRR